MRAWGILIVCAGVACLLFAMNMDTSVATSGGLYVPSRVENIGLIAQRQNYLFGAGLITLIGALMAIFGGPRPPLQIADLPRSSVPDQPPGQRDIGQDSDRLWLAAKYDIRRNEVFDRFVLADQTFEDLDSALEQAHAAEEVLLADAAAREDERRKEADRVAADHAEMDAAMAKFLKIAAVVLVIGCILGAPYFYRQMQESAARVAAQKTEARRQMSEALAAWKIDLPPTWQFSSIRNVTVADDEIWCDGNAGTLLNIDTPDDPAEVAGFLDKALGTGVDPFEGVSGGSESESRVYSRKGGHQLHVYAARGAIYLCDVDTR
jgi:hypothetical protein